MSKPMWHILRTLVFGVLRGECFNSVRVRALKVGPNRITTRCVALFVQSFRRKQLHWVVRSCKPVPIRLHVHLFTVAHLHSEHFRPNFTYTIQFLYPSTSFSCTFACSVSTQPKFMRLLLKPVLFCSHASNSTA